MSQTANCFKPAQTDTTVTTLLLPMNERVLSHFLCIYSVLVLSGKNGVKNIIDKPITTD